jgi:hypothetical protein
MEARWFFRTGNVAGDPGRRFIDLFVERIGWSRRGSNP